MFIVVYDECVPNDFKKKYEILDSTVEFRAFITDNKSFYFIEVWRIIANFGSKDIDKKCFDAIYSAKVGVKTTVENEEFEEFNDEHMVFIIESASRFQM